ncbi:MAG: response regulator, partial [Methylococcales bacterium]|nr:response regulator [Methylococcales bacterium]
MRRLTVAVVEDEDAIRDMLTVVLHQGGFDCVAHKHAEAAQQSLAEQVPDLILLDWMLPGISGVEWARRLKKETHYRNIPIILLTARGEEEDKVRG